MFYRSWLCLWRRVYINPYWYRVELLSCTWRNHRTNISWGFSYSFILHSWEYFLIQVSVIHRPHVWLFIWSDFISLPFLLLHCSQTSCLVIHLVRFYISAISSSSLLNVFFYWMFAEHWQPWRLLSWAHTRAVSQLFTPWGYSLNISMLESCTLAAKTSDGSHL